MTMKQLASRMNMTIQGITDLESREARGAVTLMSLREAARALDMQFVYGFTPNADSLDSMLDARSRELAKTIVLRTHQTMHLEDQANKKEAIEQAIDEAAAELKRNMSKSLWD
jgi:predicted DNA-binding mobile mystery protein A